MKCFKWIMAVIILMPCLPALAGPEDAANRTAQDSTELICRMNSLIRQLGDDDYQVRESATQELIVIGRPAVPYLSMAFECLDGEVSARSKKIVRITALKERVTFSTRLEKCYPEIYSDLQNSNSAEKLRILETITSRNLNGRLNKSFTKTDIGMLTTEILTDIDEPLTVQQKIDICGFIRPEKVEINSPWMLENAVPRVRKLLIDEDEEVRKAAIGAIAILTNYNCIDDIMFLLEDEDINVRLYAFSLFDQSEGDKSECLLSLIRSSYYDSRHEAIRRIGQLGNSQYAVYIAPYLQDESPDVRRVAASALGELRATEYLSEIKGLLRDENGDVRMATVRALLKINATETMTDICVLLGSENYPFCDKIADAIWEFSKKESLPVMLNILESRNVPINDKVAQIIMELSEDKIALLKYPNPNVRIRALMAAGRSGNKDTVKDILPLLGGGNIGVCKYAIYALGDLKAVETAQVIIPYLKSDEWELKRAAVVTLSQFGVPDEEIEKLK